MASLPLLIRTTIASNRGLHRYLESLQRKQDYTPRSWLYDGYGKNPFMSPDDVRDKWLAVLQSLADNGDEYQKNVVKFDTAQLSKWGPQGGHAPISQLMKDVVLPSFRPDDWSVDPSLFSSAEWTRAKQRVLKLWRRYGISRLRPRSYERVVEHMHDNDTLQSNSGYPDFTRRSNPDVKARAIEDARNGHWISYPAVTLFRTYRGKTRIVWIFPMAANIVEASYFQVLEEAILNSEMANGFFSPWKGFEAVRRLISKAYLDGFEVAASDFSSTDAHFQLRSSLEVYDVISECFQPQYRALLKKSIEHMHQIPLLTGPNSMLTGSHGVSSGSNWTNFVETVFDQILGEYVAIVTKGAVLALFGIGDDMAWICKRFRESFRHELETIGMGVGQMIKAEKTMVESDFVKSLQRLFQRGYVRQDGLLKGVYSTVRALMSSIYPERFHKAETWSSDMFCARQFMILENCVDHPLFDEFVRFICKGNQHLIPFAQRSSEDLDLVTRKAKLIPGLNPTYNQEKRDSSLANFKSIRVARKIA